MTTVTMMMVTAMTIEMKVDSNGRQGLVNAVETLNTRVKIA